MDFDLSDDQRALQEGIAALVDGVLPLERTRAGEGAANTVNPEAWSALADAGVFSLLVADTDGSGFGLAEASLIFEELGRVLATGPLIATTALGPDLPAAASGIPHAVVEAPDSGPIPTLLEHPGAVTSVVILPRLQSVAEPATLLERSTLDLTAVAKPLDPLTPLSVVATPLPDGDVVDAINVTRLRQRMMVLAAATQVGIAGEVVRLAVDYAKGREQFGRPIGGFQAIKHLLADALAKTELARSSVHSAAVMLDDDVVTEREADTLSMSTTEMRWRAVAGAKLLADEAAIANARTSIQIHGGMGFTWEVPVHLYLKRARLLASSFGNRSELSDMLAALA